MDINIAEIAALIDEANAKPLILESMRASLLQVTPVKAKISGPDAEITIQLPSNWAQITKPEFDKWLRDRVNAGQIITQEGGALVINTAKFIEYLQSDLVKNMTDINYQSRAIDVVLSAMNLPSLMVIAKAANLFQTKDDEPAGVMIMLTDRYADFVIKREALITAYQEPGETLINNLAQTCFEPIFDRFLDYPEYVNKTTEKQRGISQRFLGLRFSKLPSMRSLPLDDPYTTARDAVKEQLTKFFLQYPENGFKFITALDFNSVTLTKVLESLYDEIGERGIDIHDKKIAESYLGQFVANIEKLQPLMQKLEQAAENLLKSGNLDQTSNFAITLATNTEEIKRLSTEYEEDLDLRVEDRVAEMYESPTPKLFAKDSLGRNIATTAAFRRESMLNFTFQEVTKNTAAKNEETSSNIGKLASRFCKDNPNLSRNEAEVSLLLRQQFGNKLLNDKMAIFEALLEKSDKPKAKDSFELQKQDIIALCTEVKSEFMNKRSKARSGKPRHS